MNFHVSQRKKPLSFQLRARPCSGPKPCPIDSQMCSLVRSSCLPCFFLNISSMLLVLQIFAVLHLAWNANPPNTCMPHFFPVCSAVTLSVRPPCPPWMWDILTALQPMAHFLLHFTLPSSQHFLPLSVLYKCFFCCGVHCCISRVSKGNWYILGALLIFVEWIHF